MKAIICAGGTGGHIYPALAILNKIKDQEPNSEILYIGTTTRMEHELIPKLGIDFVGIDVDGLDRKNIFNNIKVFLKYRRAIKEAKKVIKGFNPDIVVGAGGYITLPVLIAANKLGYKTLIHEQNSIPGLSNKIISKYADKICISLPKSKDYFRKEKVVYTGNPRSEELINIEKKSKKEYGFDKNKKLVIIVMGSLGSTTMTKKIKDMIPKFENKDYQVLIITGKSYFDSYKDNKLPSNVKIVPFLEDFISLLKDTDLIISRAGASTIAEITAIGLPSILVPSPYVTNNHQYKNAKELEDIGAAKLITEEEFNGDIIIKEISNILDNHNLYENMKKASSKLGVIDSSTRIYNEIEKIIKEDSNELVK